MKKIIKFTESDLGRLVERVINEMGFNVVRWFMRRRESFEIELGKQLEELDPCSFGDEFEFSDNVISWAMEDAFNYDEYVEFEDELIDIIKEEYGDQLFETYFSAGCDD